jgi:NAD(P)H-dependent FMN reductase
MLEPIRAVERSNLGDSRVPPSGAGRLIVNTPRLLNVPVILGTVRKGRASEHAARLFADLLNRRAGVVSRVIDIATVPMPVDDAGEAIKDPAFAKAMTEADGLVIVSPEYNHSFPGLLKHVLDSCLSEYIHKAVGIVGVSAGPFAGARVIQGLLPVMREVGLVTIFWDVNIGTVAKVFAEDDRLLDDAVVRRAERFIRELIWMTKVLRHGREHVTVDEEAVERPLTCKICGAEMTHHGDKEVTSVPALEDVTVVSAHTCPNCGAQEALVTSVTG